MGIEPPFLYDHPLKYSFTGPTEKAFNPKAVSQASLQAAWSPPRPCPKTDGPLINAKEFNRHPDSYFVVPYGNLDWKPMSPNTKKKVKYVRWTQLLLRVCALIGAVGMLFCVICIKGTQDTISWIMRVPPGVAILHTIYAIYHLARSSKGRTALSSASYMIFASIVDVGLIPFFVFTALMARTQYKQPSNTQNHWKTLLSSNEANYKILFSLFLVSVVNGSLHLISLIISLYLAIIFRKISKLPPDMNPLEDNLTSRHKRNKSSILDSGISPVSTTTTSPNRGSRAEDPLISLPRSVPFMHTRNDSHTNISDVPHPESSPRASRTDLLGPFYEESLSERSSRANTTNSPINTPSFYNQPTSNRSSRIEVPRSPTKSPSFYDRPLSAVSSRANIARSPTKSSSIYTDTSGRPLSARPPSTRPSSTVSDNNWITHPSPPRSPVHELKHLRTTYAPIPQSAPFDAENFSPRGPLEMNPPTPPNTQWRSMQQQQQRVLIPGIGKGYGSGGGVGDIGIGKARGYGNLSGGRVVSRSGFEVGGIGEGQGGNGIRAREVSGKVAEEGRVKGMWGMAF